jgi:WD40 repeat protein
MNDKRTIRINRDLLRWIVGGIGVVGLLVALIALIVSPAGNKFNTVTWVSLAVGLVGLAGFVAIDPQSVVAGLTGRTGQYGLTTALMSIFFVAFIVALFIVVREAGIGTIDLSESQRYSLSESTINILEDLDEPIHAVAFYAEASSQRDEADLWLKQYERYSDGQITYEFVDPDRDPARALQYEIDRTGVIVFEQGERTAQADTVNERGLTTAVTRVLLGGDRILYATTGHGERSIDGFETQDFSQIITELGNSNIIVQPLNLIEQGSVPEDADIVLIAGPTGQFAASEVEAIKAYLDAGGALMLLSDPGTGGGQFGNGVLGLDFSPDGGQVATAGADSTVRIWDSSSGEEVLVLRGHASDVQDVDYSPDGRRLVSAGFDGTVRVWDAATGQEIAQLAGQTQGVNRVAYSPDGSLIASVGQNQAVNVWDASTFEPVSYSPLVVTEPLLALAFSPDSSQVAAISSSSTGTGGGSVYVWDTATGEVIARAQVHATTALGIAFSPDGATLHTAALDGVEGLLDIESGEARTFTRFPDLGISSLAVADDGTVAYALTDGSIRLRAAGAETADADIVLSGNQDIVWDVALSSSNRLLAAAGRDGSARLWTTGNGTLVQELTGHAGSDPLLDYLEQEWTLRVNDDVVVDVLTRDQFGDLAPVIYTYDSTSPITSDLGNSYTFFTLARSITTTGAQDFNILATPLMFTSAAQGGQVASWGETTDPFATGTVEFDEGDIPGPVALGYSAENFGTGARLVVIGDADFASNDSLRYTTFGNARLFASAANWLAEGDASVELPPPNFDQRLLDRPFSPVVLGLVGISLSCLLPLIMLGVGVVLWIIRRRRR